MTSFTLAGSSGTSQTISDGNTLTIAAGSGITTTAGATDTVTIASTLGTSVDLTSEVTGTLPVGNGGTGTGTAFTAGSVVFAGTSGVYSQDNSNLFWNDSTNRLGIGDASPAAALTVGSGDKFQVDTSGNILSSGKMYLGEGTPSIPSGPTLAVHSATSGSPGIAIIGGTGVSGLEYKTSNTSPTADWFSFADNTTGRYVLYDNITGGTTQPFQVEVGTPENTLYLDSTGGVGIGTNSPHFSLELRNNITTPSFAMSDDDVSHPFTDFVNADVFTAISSLSTTAGGGSFASFSDTDATALRFVGGIGSTNPTDTTPAILFISAKSNGTTGIADLGSAETLFQVANNDNTPALTILGSGNVGIGDTTPAALLTVGSGDKFQVDGSGNITSASLASGSTQCLQADSSGVISGTGSACGSGSGGMSIGGTVTSGTSGSILFVDGSTHLAQDNSNFFWDDSSNRLGIGTNSPDTSLEIFGTSNNLQLSYDATHQANLFTDSDGQLNITSDDSIALSPASNVHVLLPSNDDSFDFTVRNSDDVDVLEIDSDGWFGISSDGTHYAGFYSDSNGELTITPDGNVANLGGGTTRTALRFLENSGNGSNYVAFQAPTSITSDVTWTLPSADSSGVLRSNGSGTLSIGDASLTSDVTGVLPLANGGTNKNLTASNGSIVYSDADSFELLAGGTSGRALISGGSSAPTWFAPTAGSVLFAGTSGVLAQDNSNLFWDDSTNRLGIGDATPDSVLNVEGTVTTSGSNAVAGVLTELTLTNSTSSGFQFGNRNLVTVNGTVAGTEVGQFIRMTDDTSLANTVRGLEVQAYSGTNNNGINTGIATFGKTFGLQAETTAQAGSVVQAAAVFADLNNSADGSLGNAIRAFTDNATSADLVSFVQDTSTFTGNGLIMNFAAGSGSFTGNFINLQKNSTTLMHVDDDGSTFVSFTGTGTANAVCHTSSGNANNDELVDCTSTPAADYAEMYPVASGIEPGEVVMLGQQTVTTYDQTNGVVDWTKAKGTIKQLVRADQPYAGGIVGVVSDNYGDFISTGYNIKPEDNPKSVALNGRVPVRVNLDNGPIQPGDWLTASRIPGVAMRADKPGTAIGQALAPYDGTQTSNLIMVFVHTTYYDPTTLVEDNGGIVLQRGATTTTLVADSANAAFLINQNGAGDLLSLQANGADRFLVKNNGAININAISADDQDQIAVIKSNDEDVFTISARGDVAVKGNIIVRDDNFAGSIATAEDGTAEVDFTYDLGTGKPDVQLTPESESPVFAQIADWQTDNLGRYTGFTIKTFALNGTPTSAIVHYLVVGKPDGYDTVGTVIQVVNAPQEGTENSEQGTGDSDDIILPTDDNGTVAGDSTSTDALPPPDILSGDDDSSGTDSTSTSALSEPGA
jgi:hypothetical protein